MMGFCQLKDVDVELLRGRCLLYFLFSFFMLETMQLNFRKDIGEYVSIILSLLDLKSTLGVFKYI